MAKCRNSVQASADPTHKGRHLAASACGEPNLALWVLDRIGDRPSPSGAFHSNATRRRTLPETPRRCDWRRKTFEHKRTIRSKNFLRNWEIFARAGKNYTHEARLRPRRIRTSHFRVLSNLLQIRRMKNRVAKGRDWQINCTQKSNKSAGKWLSAIDASQGAAYRDPMGQVVVAPQDRGGRASRRRRKCQNATAGRVGYRIDTTWF